MLKCVSANGGFMLGNDRMLSTVYWSTKTTVAKITLLRGNASVPHPLLWRNEASLLIQWRNLNACFCTLCAVGAAVSAFLLSEHVIRRHSDVVGDSSGRSDAMYHSCAPVTKTTMALPLKSRTLYYSTKTSVRSEGMRHSGSTHSTCHSHPSLLT